ncbi:MAG: hypothetical protein JRE13_05685 [Deltaproteobacteria bacterium]|nr:hypothetical protein [Deltaproteobacteria bacterium]
MMRRAVAMGLSGFFLTEEAIRKAVGDTLPKEIGPTSRSNKVNERAAS